MGLMARKSRIKVVRPRFRIFYHGEIALGPGKADLLQAIDRTGSINAAASRLGMSYMRAWNLVKTMNACFKRPLVSTVRGGSGKGGAKLTATGLRILQLYDRLEARSLERTRLIWAPILKELRD